MKSNKKTAELLRPVVSNLLGVKIDKVCAVWMVPGLMEYKT